jgi:hypothetical protein
VQAPNDGPAVVLAPTVARLLKARQPLDAVLICDDVPVQFMPALAWHVASRPAQFPHEVARTVVKLAGLDRVEQLVGAAAAKNIRRRFM